MYAGTRPYVKSEFTTAIGTNSSVPMTIPGAITWFDWVHFRFPEHMRDGYSVYVPSLIFPHTKLLGPLAPKILLPNAQLDPQGNIMVRRTDGTGPIYVAGFQRGSTFIIPEGAPRGKYMAMERLV